VFLQSLVGDSIKSIWNINLSEPSRIPFFTELSSLKFNTGCKLKIAMTVEESAKAGSLIINHLRNDIIGYRKDKILCLAEQPKQINQIKWKVTPYART
jgi:hypothetical protein